MGTFTELDFALSGEALFTSKIIAMRVQRKTRSRTIDNQIYFVKIPDPPLSEQQQTRRDLIFENMVGEN